MQPVCLAAEMRELDRQAIQDLGLPGPVLMENAGRLMAQEIKAAFGPLAGRRVAIVCGRGNNGGDGLVIGRWLDRWGAKVVFYLLAEPESLTGDAALNFSLAKRLNLPFLVVDDRFVVDALPQALSQADMIVDALLGTGLSSDLTGRYLKAVQAVNASGRPVAAVDIPSGLSADTAQVLGAAVQAHLTVTFGLPKLGQVIHPGVEICGRLVVADIGLPDPAWAGIEPKHFLIEPADLRAWWPRLRPDGHKGLAGHLLILSGSPGKTGAAALTARGALRAGAGLVTVGAPAGVEPVLAGKLLEAMSTPLPQTSEGFLSLSGQEGLSQLLAGKTALALGPGLGLSPETGDLLVWLLDKLEIPAVIDADGLTLLAGRPEALQAAKAPMVLTPHPGEMARLTGLSPARIQADRIGVARSLARQTGAVVLLKGARSVVASPDGRILINPTGNPGLASGGTGDVLTGIVGALLAQGLAPLEAAAAGAFAHGLAADLLLAETGGRGFLAHQVADALPRTVAGALKA